MIWAGGLGLDVLALRGVNFGGFWEGRGLRGVCWEVEFCGVGIIYDLGGFGWTLLSVLVFGVVVLGDFGCCGFSVFQVFRVWVAWCDCDGFGAFGVLIRWSVVLGGFLGFSVLRGVGII